MYELFRMFGRVHVGGGNIDTVLSAVTCVRAVRENEHLANDVE